MNNLVLKYRRPFIVALELALVALSNQIAFWLRFDQAVPEWAVVAQMRMLPWLIVIRGVTFMPFRLYSGLWRYTGLWELRNIIGAVISSSLLFSGLVASRFGTGGYPRSVFIIDAIVLVCLLTGLRLSQRMYRELGPAAARNQKRVLVFGAGDAGAMIVRDMRHYSIYTAVGFIDDDPRKVGQHIHGVPVLGTRADLGKLIREHRPHEVLIAVPSLDGASVRELMKELEPFKVALRTLPNIKELLDGTVTVSQIRNLSIEDLLARPPVNLNPERLRALVRGKRVLVTGAGGSIGSELCRQIAALKPGMLVLFERYENSLYAIDKELCDRGHGSTVRAVIADVTDAARLDAVFAEHAPQVVFHAAAHKHVPLMELNASEAVKNNVIGTRMAAEAAERFGVERFIMISTDKAVNPTSVMGATKRVAELRIQQMAARSWTSFVTVRFGNVLGSNGSVVPRFQEQIAAGGPVTVTHPDIQRFFMLIPEAVQLVLHAAAAGMPGAVYVLEMGEQIKLVDMARNLIRLSGFIPDEDIQITYVGLRPGEKLYEELVAGDEESRPSPIEKVLQVEARRGPDPEFLMEESLTLERLAIAGDTTGVLRQLAVILPTFRQAADVVDVAVPEVGAPTHARSEHVSTGRSRIQMPASRGGCRACGSARIRRSKSRTFSERFRKKLTTRRPYQCEVCRWRGWITPIDTPQADTSMVAMVEAPDLSILDATIATTRYGQTHHTRRPPSDLLALDQFDEASSLDASNEVRTH